MGQWGFYDDENDNVADSWINIESAILPKCISKIGLTGKSNENDWALQNGLRRSYTIDNPKKVYEQIKKK